jgi:hypothetical protein
MAFFDKLTKAVSDTVDRGKKEVDQFMRIQKVKADIGREEQAIRDAGTRAQQVKQEIGDLVIARLKAGTLADGELRALGDRVAAIDGDVAGHQAVIVEKRAEITRIEAEGSAPEPPLPPLPAAPEAPSAGPSVAPPPLPVAPVSVPVAPVSVPAVPPVTTTCPQCGATIDASASFCTECGAKLA